MKWIKSQLFFTVSLGMNVYLYVYTYIPNLSNISHLTKENKILTLEYHGMAYNVIAIQFIVLTCVNNSACNVT